MDYSSKYVPGIVHTWSLTINFSRFIWRNLILLLTLVDKPFYGIVSDRAEEKGTIEKKILENDQSEDT